MQIGSNKFAKVIFFLPLIKNFVLTIKKENLRFEKRNLLELWQS